MSVQQEQARFLIECLPHIKRFYGQTIVIKYGGHAMENDTLKQAFAKNIALLRYVGINPVIVHGGGPQIGSMLDQLHIQSTFREGQRVTDAATMEVVEMVLVGSVNKDIVNRLNLAGVKAVGLSGKDAHLIKARKLQMTRPGSLTSLSSDPAAPPDVVDLGKVGEVVRVETSLLTALHAAGFTPVIAPVGVDDQGEAYNINADAVAGAVAAALGAKRLLLLTDVAGVLDGEKKLIRSIPRAEISGLLESGLLTGGMIPKIQCCVNALAGGVDKAMIIDGRLENCILLELFTDSGIGTEIIKRAEDADAGEPPICLKIR
ncbi:MAG: acetylglutamate kinase [Deltaproteobacteria bacterium]|jgi:acetylglutamate kinase|nr:acetylglutamate kinase [Deltaproteobacteria bacterium]